MTHSKHRKQSGFTLIEILIGAVIFALVLKWVGDYTTNYIHKYRITQNAEKFSKVPIAVQRRSAHDGFFFSFWDTNAGAAATGAAITWPEDDFELLLGNYLVGRDHPVCGSAANGWNPVNTEGGPDLGLPTQMERTALVSCNELRGLLPYRIKASAVMTPDANDSVAQFVMYLNMDEVNFGTKNEPTNNIVSYTLLSQDLSSSIKDSQNGVPEVYFGLANVLNDTTDDTRYSTRECEDELLAGNSCDIIIEVNFSGTTNGLLKRTDNLNSFLDDVTFKTSVAAADRQKCNYWNRNAAGDWGVEEEVDCAIKAGNGDDDVVLVFDSNQSHEFIVTNDTANLNALCNTYSRDGNDELQIAANNTPCGILSNGDVIQLKTTNVQAQEIFGQELIADNLYSGQVSLYNASNGSVMLDIFDSAHNTTVFQIDNIGNITTRGTLNVNGAATFNNDVSVAGTFIADDDVNLNMNNGGLVKIGNPDGNNGLVISRNGGNDLAISHRGVNFEITSGNNNEGLKFNNDANELELRINAQRGIIADNGTLFHGSKSSLTGQNFDPAGVQTDSQKELSELVTADMARYLEDKSSDIQIVGIDRIEGEFTTLQKPNCLAFAADSNFSSAASNPYRTLIDDGTIDPANGEIYSRLVLMPMYFKTYNSAFGDNQIFAQHATHSTPTTWDIYLYLSGEGAFGTGAREDGAGGSLAMTLCDYGSIQFSTLLRP